MSDNQGKGPATNEGRVEKNTSRAAENKQTSKQVANQQQETRDKIKKTFGK
ncbi:MAG TPA: hypothetical protein PLV92_04265 [Pirellulaceae bacterium]|nr:hypothetical protein [Pirellulaceae bacterium]